MLAVHPCGWAVDMRRSCASVWMRTYHGQPPTRVVWFKVPDDRPFLPFQHLYTARIWRDDDKPNEGIGELAEVRGHPPRIRNQRWYDGHPPAVYTAGDRPCGALRAWQEGGVVGRDPPLEIGPDGRALCCGPRPRFARAGQVVGEVLRAAVPGVPCPSLCGAVLIPQTLHLVVTAATGGCAPLLGLTAVLVYNGVSWEGIMPTPLFGGRSMLFRWNCSNELLAIFPMFCTPPSIACDPGSLQCQPFRAVFTQPDPGSNCCGDGVWQFTLMA